MNERIRQLAEQAKKHALAAMIKIADKQEALKVYSETYDTKFAELIVQECIAIVDEYGDSDEGNHIAYQIEQHFGVEDQVEDSNQGHTCPYKEDVNGDYETLCDCDPEQTRQCAMDI